MRFKNTFIQFCMLAISISPAISVKAQKKKSIRKTTVVTIVQNEPLSVPQIKDFAFVVDIDENSNVTMRVQKSEFSSILADSSTQQSLTDFFTGVSNLQNKKVTDKTRVSFDPITIVNADNSLRFKDIVKVIQALRVSSSQKIKLKIAENLYVFIPRKIEETEKYILKPNPNTLMVLLKENYKIQLNQDEMGDITNTSQLKNTLKSVFKYREEYGILREGTNEVEQTVFVKVPISLRFSELIDLVKKVAESGAQPIGLQIDDLEQ